MWWLDLWIIRMGGIEGERGNREWGVESRKWEVCYGWSVWGLWELGSGEAGQRRWGVGWAWL